MFNHYFTVMSLSYRWELFCILMHNVHINVRNTEGAITNGQSKDTGNLGHKTHHRQLRRGATSESVNGSKWLEVSVS